MPARQVRRKPRRQVRPLARPPVRPSTTAEGQAERVAATPAANQPGMSPTRMALAARAVELARLDVTYLRHDLRNIGLIAGLMLAIIIGLSFVLK
jgi:hypothetical protein